MATLSHADRTASQAGGRHPRRSGWTRGLKLWRPDFEALVFHARWRADGVDSSMKDDEAGRERVGQLAGGYNRLARDFDLALHLARLSPSQLLLVQQARQMSWTAAQIDRSDKPYPFRLPVSEIARLAELERSGLNKQYGQLVTKRVFIDLGDGRHLINKDYRTWVRFDGSPLLSTAQVRACLQLRRRVRPGLKTTQALGSEPPRPDLTTWVENHPEGGLETTQAGKLNYPTPQIRTGLETTQLGPSPQTPIEESRGPAIAGASASERVKREGEREESLSPARSSEIADRGRRAGEGETEAVRWVKARLETAFPGDESTAELSAMWVTAASREGWTLAQIQEVVIRCVSKNDARRCLGLMRKILSDPRPEPTYHRIDPGHVGPPAPAVSRAEQKRRAFYESLGLDEEAQS